MQLNSRSSQIPRSTEPKFTDISTPDITARWPCTANTKHSCFFINYFFFCEMCCNNSCSCHPHVHLVDLCLLEVCKHMVQAYSSCIFLSVLVSCCRCLWSSETCHTNITLLTVFMFSWGDAVGRNLDWNYWLSMDCSINPYQMWSTSESATRSRLTGPRWEWGPACLVQSHRKATVAQIAEKIMLSITACRVATDQSESPYWLLPTAEAPKIGMRASLDHVWKVLTRCWFGLQTPQLSALSDPWRPCLASHMT